MSSNRFLEDELNRFKKQAEDTVNELKEEERKKDLFSMINGCLEQAKEEASETGNEDVSHAMMTGLVGEMSKKFYERLKLVEDFEVLHKHAEDAFKLTGNINPHESDQPKIYQFIRDWKGFLRRRDLKNGHPGNASMSYCEQCFTQVRAIESQQASIIESYQRSKNDLLNQFMCIQGYNSLDLARTVLLHFAEKILIEIDFIDLYKEEVGSIWKRYI